MIFYLLQDVTLQMQSLFKFIYYLDNFNQGNNAFVTCSLIGVDLISKLGLVATGIDWQCVIGEIQNKPPRPTPLSTSGRN